MAKIEKVDLLASFDDITDLAVIMPGCKCILYYVDNTGAEKSIELDNIANIRIETDAKIDQKDATEKRIETKNGSVKIDGKLL